MKTAQILLFSISFCIIGFIISWILGYIETMIISAALLLLIVGMVLWDFFQWLKKDGR